MIDTRNEIERRLSVLRGLELSGVHHAADMLTLTYDPLRQVTNFKGALKYVGAWALHVQCAWRLEAAGRAVATKDSLRGLASDVSIAELEKSQNENAPPNVGLLL